MLLLPIFPKWPFSAFTPQNHVLDSLSFLEKKKQNRKEKKRKKEKENLHQEWEVIEYKSFITSLEYNLQISVLYLNIYLSDESSLHLNKNIYTLYPCRDSFLRFNISELLFHIAVHLPCFKQISALLEGTITETVQLVYPSLVCTSHDKMKWAICSVRGQC